MKIDSHINEQLELTSIQWRIEGKGDCEAFQAGEEVWPYIFTEDRLKKYKIAPRYKFTVSSNEPFGEHGSYQTGEFCRTVVVSDLLRDVQFYDQWEQTVFDYIKKYLPGELARIAGSVFFEALLVAGERFNQFQADETRKKSHVEWSSQSLKYWKKQRLGLSGRGAPKGARKPQSTLRYSKAQIREVINKKIRELFQSEDTKLTRLAVAKALGLANAKTLDRLRSFGGDTRRWRAAVADAIKPK